MRTFLSCLFFIFSSTLFAYNPAHLETFQQSKTCESCDLNTLNLSANLLGSPDYSDSILTGSYMYGSSIEHLNLQRLYAREMTAVGLMMHDNDLTDANFSYSDFPRLKVTRFNRGDRVSFAGSTLDYCDFSYTVFNAPNLRGAAMRYALLYRVEWPNANLSHALLLGADLTFAHLQGANLEDTNLTGALVNHADFSGANLYGAQITAEQLKKAASICGAILPDGSLGAC